MLVEFSACGKWNIASWDPTKMGPPLKPSVAGSMGRGGSKMLVEFSACGKWNIASCDPTKMGPPWKPNEMGSMGKRRIQDAGGIFRLREMEHCIL